jgi:hypothetical protein
MTTNYGNSWPYVREWVNLIQGGSWARDHFHNYRYIRD